MVHRFCQRAALFIALSSALSAFVATTHAGEAGQMRRKSKMAGVFSIFHEMKRSYRGRRGLLKNFSRDYWSLGLNI